MQIYSFPSMATFGYSLNCPALDLKILTGLVQGSFLACTQGPSVVSPAVCKPFRFYLMGYREVEYSPCHLGAYMFMEDRNTHTIYVCRGSEIRELPEAAALERGLACQHMSSGRGRGKLAALRNSGSKGSGGIRVSPMTLNCLFFFFLTAIKYM